MLRTVVFLFIGLSLLQVQVGKSENFTINHRFSDRQSKYESGQYLSSKCINNAGVREYAAFQNALYELQGNVLDNLNGPRQMPDEMTDDIKILCSETKDNAREYIKVVLDKMAICLSVSEQYLPKFLMDWFDNTVKFLCLKEGQAIKDFVKAFKQPTRSLYGTHMTLLKCFLQQFPQGAYEIADEIIEQRDFCGYVFETKLCLLKDLPELRETPAAINKYLISIADLATSSCVRN